MSLDKGVLSVLQKMESKFVLPVLTEFLDCNLGAVGNPSAYLMTMLRNCGAYQVSVVGRGLWYACWYSS